MMKLYSSGASPFVRKVRMTAMLKGLHGQIEEVFPDATKGDADLNRDYPVGRLPALMVDGKALYDSRVICEYLDVTGAGPSLIPAAGAARWDCLTRAALADAITESALTMVYERRFRPETMVVQPWLDRQRSKIDRALAELEAAPPAMGALPDYGHLTLACALGYLDFRHPGSWRDAHPKLVAWLDRYAGAVPAFAATTPKG